MTTIKQHEVAVSSYIENMILPSEPLMPLWNRENFIYYPDHESRGLQPRQH